MSAELSSSTDHIDAVAVVIPARNEEDLVSRALHAVRRAARETQAQRGAHAPRIEIILVADDCQDATAQLAREVVGVQVLEISSSSVGAARAVGIERALASLVINHGIDAEHIWIASTDADSVVPPHWISDQLAVAEHGTDVLVGTVRPDFSDLTADQIEHWLATHSPGEANGHVHGANLGVRASLYLAVGGFHAQREHEDVDLVSRLAAAGARVCAADSGEVLTSGRLVGRTPGGYAGFLRSERSHTASGSSGSHNAMVSRAETDEGVGNPVSDSTGAEPESDGSILVP